MAFLQTPASADVHIMGAGIGTTGTAQGNRLDFDAQGPVYFVPMADPMVQWDCRHDPVTEADRPEADRDGFTFSSLVDGTTTADAGTVAGHCTGTPSGAIGYPQPVTIACPGFVGSVYARVGRIVQIAGTCFLQWDWQFANGDFTVTAVLAHGADSETSNVAAVAFRFRA